MRKIVIGIDVSKEKLDFCVQSQEKILQEFIIENSVCSIKSSLKKVLKEHRIQSEEVLLCAEHTGQYSYPLSCACDELSIGLWLENPAQIKLSSGVHRGKNDKIDARKIAAYAFRFQDRVRLERQIKDLELSIAEIEQEIERLIRDDERDLLVSIDGVGEKVAVKMIVETNAFRDFKNAGQFCCHAGVAPFKYYSGSSIRSRNRVSHRADKSI